MQVKYFVRFVRPFRKNFAVVVVVVAVAVAVAVDVVDVDAQKRRISVSEANSKIFPQNLFLGGKF